MHQPANAGQLAKLLTQIEKSDKNYDYRYKLVFEAVVAALALGYKAGIGHDPKEPTWPVVFIELPTGQVSWHMEHHNVAYDHHDTKEKYRRCHEFIENWNDPAKFVKATF